MSNKVTKTAHKSEATQLTFVQRFNKKNPVQKSWFFWVAIIGLALLSGFEYVIAYTDLMGPALFGPELTNEAVRIAFAWTATTAAAVGLFKLIKQERDWLWWFGYGVLALGVNGLWLGKTAQLIKRLMQASVLFYSGYVWSKQARKHLPEGMPVPPKGVMPITPAPRREMLYAAIALAIIALIFGFILPQFGPMQWFTGSSKMFGSYQTEILVLAELNGNNGEIFTVGSTVSESEWDTFNKVLADENINYVVEYTKGEGYQILNDSGVAVAEWQNTDLGNTMSTMQEYFDSVAIWGAFWGSFSMINKRWQSQSFKFLGDFLTLIGYLLMGAWVSVFSQIIFNTVQLFGMADWKEQSDYNVSKGLTTVEAYVEYKYIS